MLVNKPVSRVGGPSAVVEVCFEAVLAAYRCAAVDALADENSTRAFSKSLALECHVCRSMPYSTLSGRSPLSDS